MSFAVFWTLDCLTFCYYFPPAPDTLQIDINACVTAKEVGEVSSNNDEGKENVKESKIFLLIYSVLESE